MIIGSLGLSWATAEENKIKAESDICAEVKKVLPSEPSNPNFCAELMKSLSSESTKEAKDFISAEEVKTVADLDFGTEFTKALSPKNEDYTKDDKKANAAKNILIFADTYIAESDYAAALDILGDTPDGSAKWYEIYGSAALGDRKQSKALWAFKEARKLYEEQGDAKKVNNMNAMINALSPSEKE